MIHRMRIREAFQKFSEFPHHTQSVIGFVVALVAVAFLAALTALLIVIDIYPTGVGAVLAFLTAIVALLISKRNAPPPQEQGQVVSPYRW